MSAVFQFVVRATHSLLITFFHFSQLSPIWLKNNDLFEIIHCSHRDKTKRDKCLSKLLSHKYNRYIYVLSLRNYNEIIYIIE